MTVLIKGMEMPKNCYVCPFCDYASARCDAVKGTPYTPQNRYEARAEWCPLVPVPEHGRLIDGDALGNSLEKLAADKWNQKTAPVNWSYAFEECLEMVDNAPTIIEQNFIKAPTIIPADKEGE